MSHRCGRAVQHRSDAAARRASRVRPPLDAGTRAGPAAPRLAANESVLIETCNLLTVAVTAKHRIEPAGEWLLDNFYLIEEQIRTARRHLPKGYSRELPSLAEGASAGLRACMASPWRPSPTATGGWTGRPQQFRRGVPDGRPAQAG